MKTLSVKVLAIIMFASCSATAPERTLSDLERMELTTRLIDSNKQNTFNACANVLQNSGYILDAADLSTGMITAIGESSNDKNFWTGDRETYQVRCTVFVEEKNGKSQVRTTFVQKLNLSSMSGTTSLDYFVENATVYRNFFNDLGKILFVRNSSL